MTHRLRFGVLGTAKIARTKVVPAMRSTRHCEVTAIASRDLDRAQSAARDLGIANAHGSYDALLADDAVDAVYVPLPNHLHVTWSIHALEAGKHVLCEKPIGIDAGDAMRLVESARRHPNLKAMEAFMYRHHPQWHYAKASVEAGALGEIEAVHTHFAYCNLDPDNIRNRAEAGGGALMDVGCYALSVSRWLFGDEPERVLGTSRMDARFGTDATTSGILDFGRGASTFTCATQLAPSQRVDIHGQDGRLTIEVPFNAPPDTWCQIHLQRGRDHETREFGPADQFALQADAFARAVLEDAAVPVSLDDAVANMAVLDAVRRSARGGRWEAPEAPG